MHVEPHRTTDQLAELIRAEPRTRVARQLAAVRLALLGHTAPDVAEQVLLSERPVRTWVARYNDGGPDALADRPGRGRKRALTDVQQQRLRDRLRVGPTKADGGAPCGARTSAASWRRSSAWSAASRPSTTCYTAWSSSPCAPCPGTPRPTRPQKPSKKPPRLPPYSPELNPVERLWLYLRSHYWSNRVYADIEALEEAAVSGWRAVCLNPEKVKSICRCEYLPAGR